MEKVLNDPNNEDNKKKIETAFGTNPNLDMAAIKATVARMKTGPLPLRTADSTRADGTTAWAATKLNTDAKGDTIFGPDGNIFKHVDIGKTFYDLKPADQAGILIHEATHYQSWAGDHVDKTPEGKHTIIGADRSDFEGRFKFQGGCEWSILMDVGSTDIRFCLDTDALNPDKTPVWDADMRTVKDARTALQGSNFHTLTAKSPNMQDNADSYRVFASLCSRALYKRALTKRDPVCTFHHPFSPIELIWY